jgi:hypothetical protein
MKAIATLSFLLPALLWMTGCATINPEEFFQNKKHYETDKPFRMADDVIDASLLSQKGQVVLSADMGHGIGTDLTWAAGRKFLLSAGYSADRMSSDVQENALMHIYYPDGRVYYGRVTYQLDNELSANSGHVAIGRYRAFGKAGRNEHYLGIAAGKSTNTYTYHPLSGDGYTFSPDDLTYSYIFTETRSWMRYYFQENIGFVTPHTEGALMARLSYVRFSGREFTMSYPLTPGEMIPDAFVLHPGMKFGVGGKYIRFQMLFNWSVSLTGAEDPKWYPTRLSVGVVARLGAGHSTPAIRHKPL